MASVSFDRAADSYDATRGYTREVSDAIGAALFHAAGASPGSRFLEIGIGTGRISIPLLANGADVTGVDISPRMQERLRANLAAAQSERPDLPWGTLDARVADMTALPFPAESCDAVVAVHVFHLVDGWHVALDEALRVLRPGGALLIGQDRFPDSEAEAVFDAWHAIVRELGGGGALESVGASGYSAVLEELRGRGLQVEETTPVTWTAHRSLQESLDYLAARTSSRTWRLPDDLFNTSLERLNAWARARYGDALATPRADRAEFTIARVVKPA